MVIRGARGYRMDRPGAVLLARACRHGGNGRQRGHQLAEGVDPRLDHPQYRPDGIIPGRHIVVVVTRVEPDFIAAADALHGYEGIPGTAFAGVADHRHRARDCSRAGDRCRARAWRGHHRRAFLAREIKDRVAADKQIAIGTHGKPGRLAKVYRIHGFDHTGRRQPCHPSVRAGSIARAVYFRNRDIEPLGQRIPSRLLGAVGRVKAMRGIKDRLGCDSELAGRRHIDHGAKWRIVGVVDYQEQPVLWIERQLIRAELAARVHRADRLDEADVGIDRDHAAGAVGSEDAGIGSNDAVGARGRGLACVSGKSEGRAANLAEQRVRGAGKVAGGVDDVEIRVGAVS